MLRSTKIKLAFSNNTNTTFPASIVMIDRPFDSDYDGPIYIEDNYVSKCYEQTYEDPNACIYASCKKRCLLLGKDDRECSSACSR